MDGIIKNGGADEDLAQGVNQAYVRSALGWPIEKIQSDWPAIKVAFGEHALGVKKEDWSDTVLYQMISQKEDAKKAHLTEEFNAADPFGKMVIMGKVLAAHSAQDVSADWDGANKPFIPLPEAPAMPNMPLMGNMNPAVVAGVYNSVRPLLEGVETPLGLGTLALTPYATAGSAAKLALGGLSAVFTGIMAKGTVDAVSEAKANPLPEDATLQQQIEHYGKPAAAGMATLLAAFGTVHELKTPAERKALVQEIRGKTPEQAATVLRDEAVKTPNEALVEPLTKAADELDAISKPGVKAAQEAQMELALEEQKLNEEAAKPAEAPKTPTEPQNAVETTGERTTGIKNSAVDRQLEEMGLVPGEHGEKTTDAAEFEKARVRMEEDPFAGKTLVEELNAKARPVSAEEVAILAREAAGKAIERDKAEKAFDKAIETGDQGKIDSANARAVAAQQAFEDTMRASDVAGTSQAQAFRIRQRMVKDDFSLAAMERKVKMASKEGKITPDTQAEIKALHEKIASTQKALDDYIASRPKDEPTPKPKARPPLRIAAALSEQAQAARERIRARQAEGRQYSGLDPQELLDHAIIGADYIAKGVTKFDKWAEAMVKEMGEKIRPHLRAIYQEASKKAHEESRLATAKTRMEKRTKELQEKTAAKDITPKPKPEPLHLDKEANRLQAELEIAKQEFESMKKRQIYEGYNPFQKVATHAADLYDAARLVMTTGEFSFILRQGKMGVLSHPVLAAKAIPDTIRALAADPTEAHAINLRVLNHPDIGAAKAAKLHLLDEGASLNKQEEMLMGRLAGSIPLVKRFNQAGIVFMNRLRFDLFNEMRKSSGGLDAAEQKQLAMFVNEATGRGTLGKLEPSAVNLARVMFAPRYLASRIQLATGHSLWGGTFATRRIIAKEYARSLVGLGLYYTALKLALGSGNQEADIGEDPRSSDFGKIKIGNTRLDPLAGLSQVIVFGARTASGEKATSKGHIVPIRGDKVPYGGEKWSDVAANFARSKLHPVPGAIINLFDGTDLAGNKADVTNQALNMAAPLTYLDIYQALEEQDLPEGAALSLLAILGEGLQTYDSNKSKGIHATVTHE